MQTKVYRYRLKPPAENRDIVTQQMRLAHRYYNKLIEIERVRRFTVRALYDQRSDLSKLKAETEERQGALEEAEASIREMRQQSRSRSETKEMRQKAKALRAELRASREAFRSARKALRDDEQFQRDAAEIDAEALAKSKAARSECGVYWGTYLIQENAFNLARKSKMDPRFRRWTGESAVGVQIQKGITVDEATSGSDTRIVLDPCPAGRNGRRRSMLRGTLRLRVQSGERKEPVWAEWPITLHRPLPTGARIKRVDVHRSLVGPKEQWSAHFTLDVPGPFQCAGAAGAVAVDIGWREREQGLRVAYLCDGLECDEEVLLDPDVATRIQKVRDLQEIRDKRRDQMAPKLIEELRKIEAPEWLQEKTAYISQWRAQARFAALVLEWRERRFAGDQKAYELLEAWRKRDKHLWLWETAQRKSTLRRRREQYRRLGAKLAQSYRVLVLEDFDLRDMARLAEVGEEGEQAAQVIRTRRFMAATSELRDCLEKAFASRGGTVVWMASKDTTRRCHVCGHTEAFDAAKSVWHACGSCGATWDQDRNAAINLIERWNDAGEAGADRCKDYSQIERPKGGRFRNKHKAA